MVGVSRQDIGAYIERTIGRFHQKRLQGIGGLKLRDVLKRKNPYLFKAKHVEMPSEFVRCILDAFLSSQEEAIFGGLLEEVAVFICGKAYRGQKSSAEGVDLEFVRDGKRYIVSIKSGPNWGNSSQIKKMRDNFRKAKRILRTNVSNAIEIVAVNGCCYGKDNRPDKGDYLKVCGQRFWSLISGDDQLYLEIIEPLGRRARARNEAFSRQYLKVVERFTTDFAKDFCDAEGHILWEKVVAFNSEAKP